MTFTRNLRELIRRPAAVGALVVFGIAFVIAVSDCKTWERIVAAAVAVVAARAAVWSLRQGLERE